MSHFDSVIDPLIAAEGYAKEDEHEPGGISIFGVSLVTFRKYHNDNNITKDEMRTRLTHPDQAKPIYRWEYWDKFNGDSLESEMVAHVYMDQAANRGVPGFKELLANCLNKWFGGSFYADLALFQHMNNAVNQIPEKKFVRRFIADAQHSYRVMAFKKLKDGKYKSLEEAEEALRVWTVRTHNLLKLLE